MSTLTFDGVRTASPSRRPAPLGLLARIAREWTYWRARRTMALLSDDALHDMGLGRGEIDGAVRRGRTASRRG